MADIWIIEGGPNTRKSSLVRCLSGARNRGMYEIERRTRTGKAAVPTYVCLMAPNEETPVRTPQQVLADLKQSKADALLLPLRSHRRFQGQHFDADGYFNFFRKRNHRMMGVVLVGTPQATPSIPLTVVLQNPHRQIQNVLSQRYRPNNWTAAQVRRCWQWI